MQVVQDWNSKSFCLLIMFTFVKNAKESHMQRCLTDTQVVQDWNSKSFRVTAFAVGVMPHVHTLDLSLMSFQDIESYAQSLQLLSVQVLTNHVRPDSKATVSLLQER